MGQNISNYETSQAQNIQNNQQYYYQEQDNGQYITQQNVQPQTGYVTQNYNVQNTNQYYNQNNAQFIPKSNIPSKYFISNQQNIKTNIPNKTNVKTTYQNVPGYVKSNQICQYNIPKSTNINKQIIKKGGNPVFNTQGQIIDESGSLVQYSMYNRDKLIIGLENRSNMKIRLQLILEGLIINNTGKNYAVFYSNPKERKIFTTSILPNYNYEQIGFEFQYA